MASLSQKRLCKMEGCEADHLAKGFCERHYRQHKRGALSEEGVELREVRERGT